MEHLENTQVRDWDRIVVRVPDGMKAWLKAKAATHHRTVNGELNHILGAMIAAEKTASEQVV